MVSNEEIKQKLDSKRGIKKSDKPKKNLPNKTGSNEDIKRRLKAKREGKVIDENEIEDQLEESRLDDKNETEIKTSFKPPKPLISHSTNRKVEHNGTKIKNNSLDLTNEFNRDDSKQELNNTIYSQMEEPQIDIKSKNNPLDRICDRCGHQNPLMSIYCEKCGEKLSPINNLKQEPKKKPSIKKQEVSLNNSLSENQNTPEALLSKGYLITNPDKFEEAIKYFDKALKLNPEKRTKSLILYHKGLKLKKISGKNSEANATLKEFIKIAPSDLIGLKKIAKQIIQGIDINEIYNQTVSLNKRFNIQIRETTIGTFGHHQENFDKAVAEVTSDELRITKKGIFTGRDRGNITLRYLDMISLDEDRGWVLTTLQIRMAGNHTINLRANKEDMRIFFNVLKLAVDKCKERDRTRETKARQIENQPKIHSNNISEDPVDKLVKLAKLLEDGLIDENEFATLKANILKKG